jgi:hypothetical protein
MNNEGDKMDQTIKFKWWDNTVHTEKDFTMHSPVIPPIGSTVSIPDKVGRVTSIHFIHSPYDGWDVVVIELLAV